MPCSKKQLLANRRNAQKSTGPRTPEGKAVSSRNALKHGICSVDHIISSPRFNESTDQYENVVEVLTAELKPTTPNQNFLVTKIADAVWRSRRVVRAESALLEKHSSSQPGDSPTPDRDILHQLCIQGFLSSPRDTSVYNVLRYERKIDHRITRLLRWFRRLQRIESSPANKTCKAKNGFSNSNPICRKRNGHY